jgi:hypothetical protein
MPPTSSPPSQHIITGSIHTGTSPFCLPIPLLTACLSLSSRSPFWFSCITQSSRLLTPALPDPLSPPLASPSLARLSHFRHICHSPSPPYSLDHVLGPCALPHPVFGLWSTQYFKFTPRFLAAILSTKLCSCGSCTSLSHFPLLIFFVE